MKPYKFSFSTHLFCVIACLAFGFPVSGQVYSYEQIDKATTRNASDTILAIEFKAAEYFHVFINDYRKSKGKNALEWSNVFWLTSRNHNMWMAENGRLNHSQNKKSTHFSGKSPGERLQFVINTACSWSGENCLYNYAYNSEKPIAEAAHQIALNTFNQWKNSSGHNENMLDNHSLQGTSFVIDKSGTVWGTSLFGFCNVKSTIKENNVFRFNVGGSAPDYVPPKAPAKTQLPDEESPVNENQTQKYSGSKTTKALTMYLHMNIYGKGVKKRNYFNKAAFKHSVYMYSTQEETLIQEKKNKYFYGSSTRQRLLKASIGRSIFLTKKQGTQEYTFYQEYDSYNFVTAMAEEDIGFWLNTLSLSDYKLGGFGVKVGKRKNLIKVAVSIILHP